MNKDINKDICDEVLRALSFLEPINKEKIILSMDSEFLQLFPDFTNEELEAILNQMQKEKVLTVSKADNGELLYQKNLPKRSLWQRIKSLF